MNHCHCLSCYSLLLEHEQFPSQGRKLRTTDESPPPVSLPHKSTIPARYKKRAASTDTVLIEAFYDPVCPDSRDFWAPLKQAIDHYGPTVVSLIVHTFPLPLVKMITGGNVTGYKIFLKQVKMGSAKNSRTGRIMEDMVM
ncbi:hypothetical protein L1887_07907 [Cichorium endivia]|nr:hypothetical protein L1887_07907 [Cichorium endivia]